MPKYCKCGKHSPTFHFPEEKTPIYCTKCKPEGAVNIKDRVCKCGKHLANFNLPGENIPLWCSKCKPFNAIDIKNKKCKCGKTPSYCLEGEKKAIWCKDCKSDNAINVHHKMCECGKHHAIYNLLGELKGKWCKDCKSDDAIYITKKLCKCGKTPYYNLPGEKKAIWCFTCPDKHLEAINVISKRCKECKITQAQQKHEGYCVRCFVHLFPDKPTSCNYKVKENHIFDTIIQLLPKDISIIRDKPVGGCSLRRPDLMIDLGSHWICAENDENCHKDYDDSCENKRLMQLYTDMANRPMILIRFNCDKYQGGKSLFKICRKTGISLIQSQKDFKERTTTFAELINKYIDEEPPEKAITIEYLYYD